MTLHGQAFLTAFDTSFSHHTQVNKYKFEFKRNRAQGVANSDCV